MSLHFIIDGYNLIHQVNILKKPKLEDSRLALINFLKIHHPQGSSNNRLTVVFDGRVGGFCSESFLGIKVIFSQNQNADDKIKNLAEESSNARNIVVVTNDRGIRDYVAQLGTQVRTVQEFLAKCFSQGGKNSEGPNLVPSDAAKITDELKKIWLSK